MASIQSRLDRLEQSQVGGEAITPDKGLVQGMRDRVHLTDEEMAARRARIDAMPDDALSPLVRRMRARSRLAPNPSP